MDISSLLFAVSEALFVKYSRFLDENPGNKEKQAKPALKIPLSFYKKAFRMASKIMPHLTYEEKKVVLLLFAGMTHEKPQHNLWDLVRFFHRTPTKQLEFLSRLLSKKHHLYTDNWMILQGGWPPENQMGEFFSIPDYLSTIYHHRVTLNVIGYAKLIKNLLPNTRSPALPFFIKKGKYTTLSAFLRDIEILFSHVKFYKTLVNESLIDPPTLPWFDGEPFCDMVDTIKENMGLDDDTFPIPPYLLYPSVSILYTETFEKYRAMWVFYFYLVYLVFIRQDTQQSVDHAIQMLCILPEEISLVLSFFQPDGILCKNSLIKFVSRDFFTEEEESEEPNPFKDILSIFSKNFEVNRDDFYKLINFFLDRNEALKERLTKHIPPIKEQEKTPEESSSQIDLDWLFDTSSKETEPIQKENTTSVITVEKKETLYEIIKPNINLSKIILDEEVKQELLNAVDMTKTMKVLKKWGVKPSLAQKEASSVKILLYGISGTGKTITAQALAGEAHAKLFKVDAANLVSSFVGESTKNVKRVFEEYYNYVKSSKETVFFFINEADQLLSSRGMIHQAADKEYNQMQNLLLEEIENFQGVFIATTNLIELFDVAWNRRFNIKIRFDVPRYETRLKLWQVHISEKMPLASDVNLEKLAEYELAGGSIANVVYNAARKAAARTGSEQVITQKDFLDAIDKEMKSILGLSSKKVGFNR
ncbi:MAG: ATP-binding protein [Brevinematales bacterium]|nr:ATP-binding protein [Brevinematales bacterium]